MTQKSKSIIFYTLTISSCIYILLNPYQSAYYCKYALEMCAGSVVPSLFTFIVLSKIISGYTCSHTNLPGTVFLSRLLCLPKVLIPTTVCGLFFSAPSGAIAVCDIYKKGLCTKNQAETAATLSNNCSAAFIMSIAASCLQSTRLAFILLLSNILTTLTVYFLLFRSKQVYNKGSSRATVQKKQSTIELICTSVKDSTFATITLCGYILLFYTLSGVICDEISVLLHSAVSQDSLKIIRAVISIFFEMSSGLLSCSQTSGNLRIVLSALCVGFCGLSIIFQAADVLKENGLCVKKLILSKTISAIICPLYMLLFLFILPTKVISVSSLIPSQQSNTTSKSLCSFILIAVIFTIGTYILSYVDKSNKNKH